MKRYHRELEKVKKHVKMALPSLPVVMQDLEGISPPQEEMDTLDLGGSTLSGSASPGPVTLDLSCPPPSHSLNQDTATSSPSLRVIIIIHSYRIAFS